MLDISPDGTFLNTFADLDFEIYLQRRSSLNITSAEAVFDALERKGEVVDRKGDKLSNSGEYSRRHNRVLRRGVAMTTAVAIGQCVQGDKEKPELTNMLNEGYAVDLGELEGDDATGADVCQEYKVPSPTTKSAHAAGKGSKKDGGCPASVGHLYGLGNTEEKYRLTVLGCKARGFVGRDKPLDHATGRGAVKSHRGDYWDALKNKKATVIPAIVETFGGISPHFLKFIMRLAARAKKGGGRDGTKYGRSTHERKVILRTPHAAAICRGTGGRRQTKRSGARLRPRRCAS